MDQVGISGGGGSEGGLAPAQPSSPERRYKGVRLRKWGRWVSEIRMPNSRERIWLGSYESAERAARAFDAAAVCLRGSRGAGSLNFPESPPDVRHFPGALLTVEQIQAESARHANSPYPGAAAAASTAAGAAGSSSSYSQQQEAAAPAPSMSNDTAVSVLSPDGGTADNDGDDDVIDWSFMDDLPAKSASSSPARNIDAELVPAIDDFMYGFLHTMPPCEDSGEDVMIDGNMDQTFFSVDLWRF